MTAVIGRGRWRVGAEQSSALIVRSVANTWRQPGSWVPSIVFPLMMAAVYSAQFDRATDLAGFPEVDSFLQFILPASILQGISFNAGEAGTALALDIESGFFDRLVASPVARQSILVGRMGGGAVFSGGLAAALMAVFALFGAPVDGGIVSAIAIVLIAAWLSLAIGGFSIAVALRTGSSEATQSLFPLTFMMIFVSSAFFPTALMSGWYQSVAEANPFTFIVDPTRRIAIEGFSFADFGRALFWSSVLGAASLSLSYRMYLGRLRRS